MEAVCAVEIVALNRMARIRRTVNLMTTSINAERLRFV
jgi:hypothetical protein